MLRLRTTNLAGGQGLKPFPPAKPGRWVRRQPVSPVHFLPSFRPDREEAFWRQQGSGNDPLSADRPETPFALLCTVVLMLSAFP